MRNRSSKDESTAVYQFGKDMRTVLARNSHKAPWDQMSRDWDLLKLKEEYEELVWELRKLMFDGDMTADERKECAKRVGKEATDLGNIAMMISDRHGQLGRVE